MMITTKQELTAYTDADKNANLAGKRICAEMRFRKSYPYMVCRYLRVLRKLEYVCNQRDNSHQRLKVFLFAQRVKILDRRKNRLGLLTGIDIPVNHAAAGIRIAHPNVILNGYVGEGCIFHGNNVLGNKKTGEKTAVPRIGKHVDVGVGAMIIGDVEIADDCVIGAGAVVTRSFTTPGSILVGVPAKEICGCGTV